MSLRPYIPFLRPRQVTTVVPDYDVTLTWSSVGNSPSSKAWYTDDIDRPVKRLQKNLRRFFPNSTISLPSESQCLLTATKNIFGRHLNGIDIPHVCSRAATSRVATGKFVHAEQGSISRSKLHYEAWSKAVLDTFDASCSDGMIMALDTKLCVPRVHSDADYDKTLNLHDA